MAQTTHQPVSGTDSGIACSETSMCWHLSRLDVELALSTVSRSSTQPSVPSFNTPFSNHPSLGLKCSLTFSIGTI